MRRYLQHPAAKYRSLASTAVLVVSALLLSACETTGFGGLGGGAEGRAERLAANGRFEDAAREYVGLASTAVGPERDRLMLLAVENWLDDGDTRRARNAFNSVQKPAGGDALSVWNTNASALLLYRGEADAALDILEPMSRQPLSERSRLRVDALRADAWIQKEDPARAVEIMTQRETWLDGRRRIEQNRNRLWQGLLVTDPKILREVAEVTDNPDTRAWLTLASLARTTGQQGIGWSNGIMRWRDANRSHPAWTVLGEFDVDDFERLEYPRQIALLLPLSGRAEAAGTAVQNGFMGAYFSTASSLDEQQVVRVYDIAAEGGASAAYQTAVTDGAEFVVGPLMKSNVIELANDSLVPVPVLTLNYLPDETLPPPGLFQFALAPEDEASSVAQRALGDGHTRAVALVPNNDWGRRVLRSFATEFEGRGGRLLDHRSYTPDDRDFSTEIENLMGLSGSVQRYRRLRSNLGGTLQFDPRRRQDAEFIFLATAAGPGRLLKSQLKFHYAGDLPTYSTSLVNAMDGRSDADLNGVMFADVPWLISPQPWIQYLPGLYAEHWPEERRLARLHAMGFDAYNLIASLYANQHGEAIDVDGATGRLFIDQNGRVHRELAWAQFQRGEAVALPPQDRIGGGPIRDLSDDAELAAPDAADAAPWDESPLEQ